MPLQMWDNGTLKILQQHHEIKFSGIPGIEPGTAGWEASMLPLSYAAPHHSQVLLGSDRQPSWSKGLSSQELQSFLLCYSCISVSNWDVWIEPENSFLISDKKTDSWLTRFQFFSWSSQISVGCSNAVFLRLKQHRIVTAEAMPEFWRMKQRSIFWGLSNEGLIMPKVVTALALFLSNASLLCGA